jgi:hypothetical protein
LPITPAFAGRQAHIHYIVTGGGLSEEKNKWNKSRSNFLLPVKALSVIFRAKFRDELKKENPVLFNSIASKSWRKDWVVNSIAVGKGKKALKYLAQYVFRIAISNSRIITLENGKVAFKYKESKTKLWKTMTLEVEEFIRRFLQHVLPNGFVKVRYYGLFAVANRALLSKAREMLGYNEIEPKIKIKKVFICPECKKEMVVAIVIPRPARRCNKAPPLNISHSFNRSFSLSA